MQTYMSLFYQWYRFTLDNLDYAIVLGIFVWLLTAIVYSIRIGDLQKEQKISQKNAFEALNAVQLQLQQSQETLVDIDAQKEQAQHKIEEETKRALILEQIINQRNQQISGILQTLAISFDLGERPLLATEDVRADQLWQQHDRVLTELMERLRSEQQSKKLISQLTERLRSEQQLKLELQVEMAKLTEKEAMAKAFQMTLENQANQLSHLESVVRQQQDVLVKHQEQFQQTIVDLLQRNQSNLLDTVQPQGNSDLDSTEESLVLTVEPVSNRDNTLEVDNDNLDVDYDHQVVTPNDVENVSDEILSDAVESVTTNELEFDHKGEGVSSADDHSAGSVSKKGALNTFKKLFGKKTQSTKTEPQWSVSEIDDSALSVDQSENLTDAETYQESVTPLDKTNKQGRLKNFYNRFKTKK